MIIKVKSRPEIRHGKQVVLFFSAEMTSVKVDFGIFGKTQAPAPKLEGRAAVQMQESLEKFQNAWRASNLEKMIGNPNDFWPDYSPLIVVRQGHAHGKRQRDDEAGPSSDTGVPVIDYSHSEYGTMPT